MTFWTLTDTELNATGTECDTHALESLNLAFRLAGLSPAKTVEEAITLFEAQLILGNDPQASTLITSHEHGVCDRCEQLQQQRERIKNVQENQ